jgi:AcrR family transcriptional regulator
MRHKEFTVHRLRPPARPRSRRRLANEARILDAAAELLFAEGYDALNMKEVADAADYTPGALYRYFPSKASLLAAVVTRLLVDLGGTFAGIKAAAPDASPLARAVALALEYQRFATGDPNAFALFSSMLADARVLVPEDTDAAAIADAMQGALLPLAHELELARGAGLVSSGSAQTRALLMFTSLHGTLQLRKQERLAVLPLPTSSLVAALLQTLLIGFGATAEISQAALLAGSALHSRIHDPAGQEPPTPRSSSL